MGFVPIIDLVDRSRLVISVSCSIGSSGIVSVCLKDENALLNDGRPRREVSRIVSLADLSTAAGLASMGRSLSLNAALRFLGLVSAFEGIGDRFVVSPTHEGRDKFQLAGML